MEGFYLAMEEQVGLGMVNGDFIVGMTYISYDYHNMVKAINNYVQRVLFFYL